MAKAAPAPQLLSFQTRARTIDHLGRSQIADAPTAVSELWKNAYDAYAQNVALHIFEGAPAVAAVLDDGCGMDRKDFEDRWLVIGTETKFDGAASESAERFGLPLRQRQGEKGIGRLSAAYLAPVNIVIGKRPGKPFAAVAVDWRIFENPFLTLSDIRLPVIEFKGPDDFSEVFRGMVAAVIENTTGEDGPPDRRRRIEEAWRRLSEEEKKLHLPRSTMELIRKAGPTYELTPEHMFEWHPFAGLSEHGTAIFLCDINRELRVWVAKDVEGDPEVEVVKDRLRRTLTGFTDPFASSPIEFGYEVLLHQKGRQRREIGSTETFGPRQLHALEHLIEGRFDRRGVFKGRVRAFGRDMGDFEHQPASPVPQTGGDVIGPFSFAVGTFEQEPMFSSHQPAEHAQLVQQADKYAGLPVYRDGLRVMPYGRPDSDFFELEERRTKHVGREFWSHRRVFGRVAFSKRENPNLRDKAGREGLVDNSARRWLKMLVVDLLKASARRFFGSDSDVRKSETERIEEDNRRTQKAADEARRESKAAVRKYIASRTALFTKFGSSLAEICEAIPRERKARNVMELERKLGCVESLRAELERNKPPRLPPEAADMETPLRKLRSRHSALTDEAEGAAKDILSALDELSADGRAIADRTAKAANARFREELETVAAEVITAAQRLAKGIRERAEAERNEYRRQVDPLLEDIDKGAKLSEVQQRLDNIESRLRIDVLGYYRGLSKALELMERGIDLEGALRFADTERDANLRQMEQFHGLAQMGISAEIIGHELDTLEQEVGRNLSMLPVEVRASKAFKAAFDAHRALVERLRFLSPLKMAGYHPPEDITGEAIADFVRGIFERRFEDAGVDFLVTRAFSGMVLREQASRIYPVFVNLVNNALFWVAKGDRKVIKFDLIKDKVVIGDSGPGVGREDQPFLFTLFFTRRPGGRGVGLYLCQANLAAGGHAIRYANADDPKAESGANFVIEFQGLVHAKE